MFFELALQNEFLEMHINRQKVLDNSWLREKAILYLPKNFRNIIQSHPDKQRIVNFWKSLIHGGRYIAKPAEYELKNINHITDIESFLNTNDYDLLILEEDIAEIFIETDERVLFFNGKEACAPAYYSIEKTEIFKKIDELFKPKSRKAKNIWNDFIFPFSKMARKIQIIDRHLASYLYGHKSNMAQSKNLKRGISKILNLPQLKELEIICDYNEKDYRGQTSFSKLPDELKRFKNVLNSKDAKVSFHLGPTKFFQDYSMESCLIIDSKFLLKVDHFGQIFSFPDSFRDTSAGPLDDSFTSKLSKVEKPSYKNIQWVRI